MKMARVLMIYFLRRARNISTAPEKSAKAAAEEFASISGTANGPPKANVAVPASNIRAARVLMIYFLRRARNTSNPPETIAMAAAAELASISGTEVPPPKAKVAVPASSIKVASVFMISSINDHFFRRERITSRPPVTRATAATAEFASISGTTTAPKANVAVPVNTIKAASVFMIAPFRLSLTPPSQYDEGTRYKRDSGHRRIRINLRSCHLGNCERRSPNQKY